MKGTIQRVVKASVEVDGHLISSIGRGICVLVGIHKNDTQKDKEYLARKILSIRLWEDENGRKWSRSVTDMQYEVLCVSQFTLYYYLKGNKPDFRAAMPGAQSQEFYNSFLDILKKLYDPNKIKDGQFGAMMQVSIQNDGPVTLDIESPTVRQFLEEENRVKLEKKTEETTSQALGDLNG
ncbi:D-aminoacyl-tRNA deacylase [Frankliniella occidentalis]|uniref:D-aminoacyl-tRNA deacylase n=1 Tax=Frankliniella occidentalis TaxID=133901 RepID=A0A6J1RWJ4_FRAOC|nr:D-aminoacyl-tRNA deacylase [Frankliniella occidentalis]